LASTYYRPVLTSTKGGVQKSCPLRRLCLHNLGEMALDIATADIATELRRRRRSLRLTLQDVAHQAGVHVSHVSLVERGRRTPSLDVLARLRGALGIVDPLPAEVRTPRADPPPDDAVAKLGACLAAGGRLPIADLARLTGLTGGEVRHGLRLLSDVLGAAGMQVTDDGAEAQLTPRRDLPFEEDLAELGEPVGPSPSAPQMEILAIAVADGVTTRRRIEELRGVDSAEAIANLVERGLLARAQDDVAPGRPLLYRPTTRLLQLFGVETMEELQEHVRQAMPGKPG
jgi:chromosome segregation and condensation protein ScpB